MRALSLDEGPLSTCFVVGIVPFFRNARIVDGCLSGSGLVVITAQLPPPIVCTILLLYNMIEASLFCSYPVASLTVSWLDGNCSCDLVTGAWEVVENCSLQTPL